jgi:hypothetical protein
VSILDTLATSARGIVRVDPDCRVCGAPVAVYGRMGEGRSLDTYPDGYFCNGHAIVMGPRPPVDAWAHDPDRMTRRGLTGTHYCAHCDAYTREPCAAAWHTPATR